MVNKFFSTGSALETGTSWTGQFLDGKPTVAIGLKPSSSNHLQIWYFDFHMFPMSYFLVGCKLTYGKAEKGGINDHSQTPTSGSEG